MLPSFIRCPTLLNLWTLRRLVPDPDGGYGVDIVSWWMLLICGRFRVVQFDMSFMSLPLILCMRLDWVFVSTISLDAECPMCFPTAAIFVLFFLAAVGLCPTAFSV